MDEGKPLLYTLVSSVDVTSLIYSAVLGGGEGREGGQKGREGGRGCGEEEEGGRGGLGQGPVDNAQNIPALNSTQHSRVGRCYAVLVGGADGDGARRGLFTIVELIDPRPYVFQPPVYGRLIYTVMYMSDRLLTQSKSPFAPPSRSA